MLHPEMHSEETGLRNNQNLLQKESVRLDNVCMFFGLVAMDAIVLFCCFRRSHKFYSIVSRVNVCITKRFYRRVNAVSLLSPPKQPLTSVWRMKGGDIGEKGALLACPLFPSWWLRGGQRDVPRERWTYTKVTVFPLIILLV